jgi:hypothetical protein
MKVYIVWSNDGSMYAMDKISRVFKSKEKAENYKNTLVRLNGVRGIYTYFVTENEVE